METEKVCLHLELLTFSSKGGGPSEPLSPAVLVSESAALARSRARPCFHDAATLRVASSLLGCEIEEACLG